MFSLEKYKRYWCCFVWLIVLPSIRKTANLKEVSKLFIKLHPTLGPVTHFWKCPFQNFRTRSGDCYHGRYLIDFSFPKIYVITSVIKRAKLFKQFIGGFTLLLRLQFSSYDKIVSILSSLCFFFIILFVMFYDLFGECNQFKTSTLSSS